MINLVSSPSSYSERRIESTCSSFETAWTASCVYMQRLGHLLNYVSINMPPSVSSQRFLSVHLGDVLHMTIPFLLARVTSQPH